MLNSLWRTFGFGKPETPYQMLGRAAICLIVSIMWFSLGLTNGIVGFLSIMLLCFAAGGYVTRVADTVAAEMERQDADPQPMPCADELILNPYRDYVVNPGEPVWLTVGNYSARILQLDGGGARMQLYHLYREDEDPIAKVEV